MARRNRRQAKTDQKFKCEYSGCTTMFARDSDRRRHGKEQHGSPLYCTYPDCDFITRRMDRFGTHLNKAHHHQVSINITMPSEFRNANAQTLASSYHLSALDPNTTFNFEPTTPPSSTDYASSPQATPEVFKPYAVIQSERFSISEHNRPLGLLAAARARTRAKQDRIYKRCRVVRRPKSRLNTPTSSSASPHSHLDSTMEATPTPYYGGQENSNGFPQWMPHTVNAESFASVLDSLSLQDSSITFTASTGQQPTGNNTLWEIQSVEVNHNAAWRSDTGDCYMPDE